MCRCPIFHSKSSEEQKKGHHALRLFFIRISPLHLKSFVHLSAKGDRLPGPVHDIWAQCHMGTRTFGRKTRAKTFSINFLLFFFTNNYFFRHVFENWKVVMSTSQYSTCTLQCSWSPDQVNKNDLNGISISPI